MRAIDHWLPPAGIALLLLLWEGSVRAFGISAFVLPPLTAAEAPGGFVLALAAGVALGALIAEVRWLEKALYPLLVALQAMPKVALAPLVIIWLGYGISSKVVLACLQSIEAIAPELATARPTIGEITLGCGLGYLDFRFPELDWRAGQPAAARWYAGFAQLPAMQATLPHDA